LYTFTSFVTQPQIERCLAVAFPCGAQIIPGGGLEILFNSYSFVIGKSYVSERRSIPLLGSGTKPPESLGWIRSCANAISEHKRHVVLRLDVPTFSRSKKPLVCTTSVFLRA